jgi:hypothetical protein
MDAAEQIWELPASSFVQAAQMLAFDVGQDRDNLPRARDEGCSVQGAERYSDLGYVGGEKEEQVVLPGDAFDVASFTADDVAIRAQDHIREGRDRLEIVLESDAPVRDDVRRCDD